MAQINVNGNNLTMDDAKTLVSDIFKQIILNGPEYEAECTLYAIKNALIEHDRANNTKTRVQFEGSVKAYCIEECIEVDTRDYDGA